MLNNVKFAKIVQFFKFVKKIIKDLKNKFHSIFFIN